MDPLSFPRPHNDTDEAEDDKFSCRSPVIEHLAFSYRLFSLIEGISWMIFLFASVCFWVANRNRPYLKVRSSSAVGLSSLAFFFSCFGAPFKRWSYFEEGILNRCSTQMVMIFLALGLFFSGLMLRIITLYYRQKLLELTVQFFTASQNRSNDVKFSWIKSAADLLRTHKNGSKFLELKTPTPPATTVYGPVNRPTSQGLLSPRSTSTSSHSRIELRTINDDANSDEIQAKTFKKNVDVYRYRISNKFQRRLATGMFLSSTAVSFLFGAAWCPEFGMVEKCKQDRLYKVSGYLVIGSSLFFIVNIALLSWRTKDLPDPFRLKNELVNTMFIGFIFTIPLVAVLVQGAPKVPLDKHPIVFDGDFMLDINFFFQFFYLVFWQVVLARQHNESYYDLTLAMVLKHPFGKILFKHHLITEFSSPNLTFWYTIEDWKTDFAQNKSTRKQELSIEAAKNIYLRYFGANSQTQMNVSGPQRIALHDALFTRNREVSATVFDDVQSEVFRLMDGDSFFRFKINNLYRFLMGLTDEMSPQDTDEFENDPSL